jgi:ceramide glucosyltransferase
MNAVSLIFIALAAGSSAFCALTALAAFRYRSVRPRRAVSPPPISVLKPLSGVDDGLETNLRTFFEQEYGDFEILFAARSEKDLAIPVVERLRAEYPHVPSRLIVTGEPPYANAKVYSLQTMLDAARHDLIVMSDSDTRATPEMLSVFAAEFADAAIGLATCPYRAIAGHSFWSMLEALGLNTEFIGGVLVARMLDGMNFALGPTIVARRETLQAIGGFDAVKDYLAEDFVMGKLAAQRGIGVILSSYVIEHRIGAQRLPANWRHRLSWGRSTRRSRPRGYIGQIFTHPLPLAAIAWAVAPEWSLVAVAAVVLRLAAAWAVGIYVLRDRLTLRFWWLLPLQDIFSFLVWIGGFFGNTILWRGRKYYLRSDGRFELAAEQAS